MAATGIALGTVTSVAVVPASGWLGYFAFTTLACTTQTITTTAAVTTAWTVAAVAAPLAVMGATAYGYYRYQKNAEFRRVANAFEEEKNKIREFYQQQIEKASSPICVPVFSH